MRIATLVPSATEIVCALGLAEEIVGVSHECDFPREVAGRTVLTSSAVRRFGASGEIDRDVRRVVREALAVYEVDTDALAAAKPDLIVTQDLCDVCAVSLADVERAVRALVRPDVRIVSLHPTRLGEVFDGVRQVGAATGRSERAEAVVRALEARVAAAAARARGLPARPAVLTLEWLDPVMIGGTWMPELVELAGGRPLVTRPGDHAPTLSQGELAALAPEVVLVKPCGFELERTLEERALLERLLAALDWPATRNGAVYVADGNAYFNRPGPRLVESLEILAACVHPRAFADLAERHRGAFVRFEGGAAG